MSCMALYESPLGTILLEADGFGLTGVWLPGQRSADLPGGETPDHPVLMQACRWLDLYFSGEVPDFTPPLHLQGTAFQQAVWALLLTIPYGQTATYGALAREVAARLGKPRMSAQAVGGAVGRNPVSVIVPCHRVVGANGLLTGYAGGLDKKIALLALEGHELSESRVCL